MSSLSRRLTHRQGGDCGTITIEAQFDSGNVSMTGCSASSNNLEATFQNGNSVAATVQVTWTAGGQQIGTDTITVQGNQSATASVTPNLSGLEPGDHNVSVDASVSQA